MIMNDDDDNNNDVDIDIDNNNNNNNNEYWSKENKQWYQSKMKYNYLRIWLMSTDPQWWC